MNSKLVEAYEKAEVAIDCKRCDGTGEVSERIAVDDFIDWCCPECYGTGKVVNPDDTEISQELLDIIFPWESQETLLAEGYIELSEDGGEIWLTRRGKRSLIYDVDAYEFQTTLPMKDE